MKNNYLLMVLPFLTTIILVIFLANSNQKEYTKLRMLIWSTPSLTVGNYLAISTGTGFILSYFITNRLAVLSQYKSKNVLKYRNSDQYENIKNVNQPQTQPPYDKTLIERDLKDPSPTINASFRVIGMTERRTQSNINNDMDYSVSDDLEDEYYENNENNERNKQGKVISTDWSDESFSNW